VLNQVAELNREATNLMHHVLATLEHAKGHKTRRGAAREMKLRLSTTDLARSLLPLYATLDAV
jgi:hypothetical protein